MYPRRVRPVPDQPPELFRLAGDPVRWALVRELGRSDRRVRELTAAVQLPQNLVSFCWDGKVTKTSPTTFEMNAEDWYPPYGRELEILILNKQDPGPNVG